MTGKPRRYCAYTVLTKGCEELLDQPMANESEVDFVCFTDDPSLQSET